MVHVDCCFCRVYDCGLRGDFNASQDICRWNVERKVLKKKIKKKGRSVLGSKIALHYFTSWINFVSLLYPSLLVAFLPSLPASLLRGFDFWRMTNSHMLNQ